MVDEEELLAIKSDYTYFSNMAAMYLKELKEKCYHPNTSPKGSYCPGGYDYVASTQTWDECDICDERLNFVNEEHAGRYS